MARRGLTHRDHVTTYFTVGSALSEARGSLEQGDVTTAVADIELALEALERVAPSVSVAEASTVLGVSEPTVRLWIDKGLLDLVENAPVKVAAHDVAALADRLQVLRDAGLDKKQWAAILRAARDRQELRLPGAAEGLDEAQAMLARRRRRRTAAA